MSASIIDFVNCHTEKDNGINKYINDKSLDVKETNSEDTYITKKLNLKGVVPADVLLGTDANFNVVAVKPSIPSCFGWYDSGSGVVPPNTITVPNIIIPSFLQTGGFPLYNNPISSSFVFNQSIGIITCNEAGVYLIQQSYKVGALPAATTVPWNVGLYNRTSGRYYTGATENAGPGNPFLRGHYSQTTYDTFTAGTQLNIYGQNPDPVNSIIFDGIYLTLFRIG
jgi:hypothetical protein